MWVYWLNWLLIFWVMMVKLCVLWIYVKFFCDSFVCSFGFWCNLMMCVGNVFGLVISILDLLVGMLVVFVGVVNIGVLVVRVFSILICMLDLLRIGEISVLCECMNECVFLIFFSLCILGELFFSFFEKDFVMNSLMLVGRVG